jgi:hypothetical protein
MKLGDLLLILRGWREGLGLWKRFLGLFFF